jgi:carbamoyl-phosphate synthase small subunit
VTPAPTPALLVLEDGRTFRGSAYGAVGETFGEAVFNTGMTGYQETLTDPSYHRQVVVMTAPHIGNTGVNDEDPESRRIWVSGYVVREPSRVPSSWRSRRTLDEELETQGVVGIAGVDTRALTRHLRERGAMRVGIFSGDQLADVDELQARVAASPPMVGADLAHEVTDRPAVRRAGRGGEALHRRRARPRHQGGDARYLAAQGWRCTSCRPPRPAPSCSRCRRTASSCPTAGRPGDHRRPVEATRAVLDAGVPLFGICFGNQILGRALGLGTYKLRYGHRGVNSPCRTCAPAGCT